MAEDSKDDEGPQSNVVKSEDLAPRIVQKLAAKPASVALLCAIAAIYYGQKMLSMDTAENTRVSEHALMPGLVNTKFTKQAMETQFMKELASVKDPLILPDFIAQRLREQAVEAAPFDWTKQGLFRNSSGRSVVSVVRALRSTGAESMAIVVRMDDNQAVAMAMALAAQAREQSYWARDIFFVFIDGGVDAVDAWLTEYYGTNILPNGGRFERQSTLKGGYMIGAVVLEIPKYLARENTIHLLLNGMNGQLPNLDLFNAICRIASRVRPPMNKMIFPEDEKTLTAFPPFVPLRFLISQAFSSTQEGLHTVFGKYGVQALTVRAPPSRQKKQREQGTEELIEGILRSLNNLHERFHQSYFMYILVSPHHFSSIAFFSPILGILLVPFVMCALYEWFRIPTGGFSLHAGLPLLVLYGAGVWLLIEPAVRMAALNEDGVTRCVLAALCTPVGLFVRIDHKNVPSSRVVVLISLALTLGALGLLNFGLAAFAAFCTVPAAVLATSRTSSKLAVVARTLAIVTVFHPFTLFLLGALGVHSLSEQWWLYYNLGQHAQHALLSLAPSWLLSTLYSIIEQHYSFGCWQLPLLCMAAVPAWNCLLALGSTVDPEPEKEHKE